MTHIGIIVRKELRGFFGSPVAVLFLGAFLAATLLGCFWYQKFFARNLADIRPLFELLPLVLIVLVGALAMRAWSEELRSGTFELLMTLPIARHQVVLGKFLAGLVLLALALALTLGVPMTIAWWGPLDWGPVVGGYLAALLLGAAYLAIGLCVSASTEHQIVALMVTCLLCLGLYVPGTEAVTQLVDTDTAELLRQVATGSRFESIARGVVDIRDLAYYASLTGFFLALNTVLVLRRGQGHGKSARPTRRTRLVFLALVAANGLLLHVWLRPLHGARADLTAGGTYSLSPTTRALLGGIHEPVLLRAYFSESLPAEYATLAPAVRDLLEEYAHAAGSRNVMVEVVVPDRKREAAEEAANAFGIHPLPFRELTKSGETTGNAYFHVLVRVGRSHVVLKPAELVETKLIDDQMVRRLRPLEYEVTGAILRAQRQGEDLIIHLARRSEPVKVVVYASAGPLPAPYQNFAADLKTSVEALGTGRAVLQTLGAPPDQDEAAFFAARGLSPITKDPATGKPVFLDVVVDAGRPQRMQLPDAPTTGTVSEALRLAIRRSLPGATKVVGVWVPPPTLQTSDNGKPGQERAATEAKPVQSFQVVIERLLRSERAVEPVTELLPPALARLDLLLLLGPKDVTATEAQALADFVRRGGAVVAFAGRFRLLPQPVGGRVHVERVQTGLEDLLTSWGIEILPALVLDPKAEAIPVPEDGGKLGRVSYPPFAKPDGGQMPAAHPASHGVSWAAVHYGSPVKVRPVEGMSATKLLWSSERAWLTVEPDVHPGREFVRPATAEPPPPYAWAVALSGALTSGGPAGAEARPARVVVVGSSAMLSDEVLSLSQRLGLQSEHNNLLWLQNLLDWCLEDRQLTDIRTRALRLPALRLPEDQRTRWEYINYAIAALGLTGLLLGVWLWRRRSVGWLTDSGDEDESGRGASEGGGSKATQPRIRDDAKESPDA